MKMEKIVRNKRVFVKSSSGTKRIAPIDMRKEEHQFVIDGYLVDEVLSQIPPILKILGGNVTIMNKEKNGKIVVPNIVRKLGVTSMYRTGSMQAASIVFDQISKEAIKNNVSLACKTLNMDRSRAYFRSILLSNGAGTVRFKHVTKEIKPDETDLRKKLRVMGATLGHGKVQSVISSLNAKKYKCVIKEEPVKFVMCYKE